jgi:hypothetical protein
MLWGTHTGNFIHDFAAGCEVDKINMDFIESWILGKEHSVFVNDDKLNQILKTFENIGPWQSMKSC